MRHINSVILLYTQLIAYLSQTDCNLIEIPYYHHFSHNKIRVFIGSPRKEYELIIDLTSKLTWLNNETASLSSHDLSSCAIIHYNNKSFSARETEDALSIHNNTDTQIANFPILILDIQSQIVLREAEGVIGLSYAFDDSKYSLIHRLKQHGLISHLSFSITNPNNVTLGGITDNAVKGRFHSYCDVLGKEGKWNCRLSHVIVKDSNKSVLYPMRDGIVTFIATNHMNFAPKGFMDLLIQEFFSEKFNRRIYKKASLRDKVQIYTLLEEELFNGDLVLNIGGYSYSIAFSSFWDCYEGGCDLDLFENPQEGDEWILGSSFMGLFNTHFDYAEKKIHFYSHKYIKVEEMEEEKGEKTHRRLFEKGIYLIELILLLFGFVIVMMIYLKLKRLN